MAHIQLPDGLPGIRGLLAFRPETARPLGDLADILLHAPGTLSPGEREIIAAYVSRLNDCTYCHNSHAAIAACHLRDEGLVASVMADVEGAAISTKLKALLAVAAKVQQSGRSVRAADIARAREEGATDLEIHDTVLLRRCSACTTGMSTVSAHGPRPTPTDTVNARLRSPSMGMSRQYRTPQRLPSPGDEVLYERPRAR